MAALVALSALVGCTESGSDDGTGASAGSGGSGATGGSGASGGSGGGEACAAEGTGTLDVRVNGLPSGVEARVHLDGPEGGFDVSEAGTSERPAGSYQVLADDVVVADPIVRTVYRATAAATVCVPTGDTGVIEIEYAAVPTSNKLWTTDGIVKGYAAADLGISATIAASVLGNPEPYVPSTTGVAFDALGNMWVAAPSGSIFRLPADQLAATGDAVADVVIDGAQLSGGVPGPKNIALDAENNLWVTLGFSNTVLRYDAADLAASGAPEPSVEITTPEAPEFVAFDASGNLWVSTALGVSRFDADRLDASTADPPDLTLLAQDDDLTIGLGGASGIAFDAAGNLWAAYFGPNVIAQLPASALAGAGEQTITPLQITLPVLALLADLAFDESGHLWTAYNNGSVARLSPEQLASSGDKTPAVVIESGDISSVNGLALYPAPAGLPLASSLP